MIVLLLLYIVMLMVVKLMMMMVVLVFNSYILCFINGMDADKVFIRAREGNTRLSLPQS